MDQPVDPGTFLSPFSGLRSSGGDLIVEDRPAFICEGAILVERALSEALEGRLEIHSILATPSHGERLRPRLAAGIPLLIRPEEEVREIVGYPFHRGLLACAFQPPPCPEQKILQASRLLVLPHVDDLENLGLLLRSAGALGLEAVLLGKGPPLFHRRTVRVSMGGAFLVPCHRSEDPLDLLGRWRKRGGEVVAADPAGTEDFRAWRPSPRSALMLGPEGAGLPEPCLRVSDRRVRIPVSPRIGSLNVAAAGAVMMARMLPEAS